MGGTIGAESQVGEGSTFWFELPLPRAAEGALEAAPARPAPPPTGPRLAGMRVLVVDDSAMNRDVAERALMLEGATVTLAADGRQAVELLTSRPTAFDALLMDVRMPVMDGLTATRLIRHELGLMDLPIIAFTAGVMTEEQQAARAAGANEVLAKPVDLERMTAVLLRWAPVPRPAVAQGAKEGAEDAVSQGGREGSAPGAGEGTDQGVGVRAGEGTRERACEGAGEGAALGAEEGAGVRLVDAPMAAPPPKSLPPGAGGQRRLTTCRPFPASTGSAPSGTWAATGPSFCACWINF